MNSHSHDHPHEKKTVIILWSFETNGCGDIGEAMSDGLKVIQN